MLFRRFFICSLYKLITHNCLDTLVLYGTPATVYCDSITLIFACIIIIIIIIITINLFYLCYFVYYLYVMTCVCRILLKITYLLTY